MTAIWERVLFLQIAGEDLAVVFVDLLHRSNPALFGAGVIARVRTLYYAKGFCDQFVRAKVVFLHVGFAVGVML